MVSQFKGYYDYEISEINKIQKKLLIIVFFLCMITCGFVRVKCYRGTFLSSERMTQNLHKKCLNEKKNCVEMPH